MKGVPNPAATYLDSLPQLEELVGFGLHEVQLTFLNAPLSSEGKATFFSTKGNRHRVRMALMPTSRRLGILWGEMVM